MFRQMHTITFPITICSNLMHVFESFQKHDFLYIYPNIWCVDQDKLCGSPPHLFGNSPCTFEFEGEEKKSLCSILGNNKALSIYTTTHKGKGDLAPLVRVVVLCAPLVVKITQIIQIDKQAITKEKNTTRFT